MYQLNVTPNGPASDRIYIREVGGRPGSSVSAGTQSNIATLPALERSNALNVSGSITPLFPSLVSTRVVTHSLMFTAANFQVDFDIAPGAQPFNVVAVSEGGSALFHIDSLQQRWTATVSSPWVAGLIGDFSRGDNIVYDFSSCAAPGSSSGACSPLPNNMLPPSRLDPLLLDAAKWLSPPDFTDGNDGINGTISRSGSISGNHFRIGLDSFAGLSSFGGFFLIPQGGPAERSTDFSLYVDGKLISTVSVPYKVRQ